MKYPKRVKIVDVGPRDGLQNEPAEISTETKIELVERLADAGLRFIEAGAFVSPKWVPKMADSADVMARIERRLGVVYSVLTPNLKGFEGAVAVRADEVAVFGAASEAFSQKNINCTIAESLERFQPVCDAAKAAAIPVRGYISCVLGCPYEGEIAPSAVASVAKTLRDMGCHEISLGDTIGRGTPAKAQAMIAAVAEVVPIEEPTAAAQAAHANLFGAEVYIGLEATTERLARVTYYAVPAFESAGGRALAHLIERHLRDVVPRITVSGMCLPILRETKMPAVLLSLGPTQVMVDRAERIAEAVFLAVAAWSA